EPEVGWSAGQHVRRHTESLDVRDAVTIEAVASDVGRRRLLARRDQDGYGVEAVWNGEEVLSGWSGLGLNRVRAVAQLAGEHFHRLDAGFADVLNAVVVDVVEHGATQAARALRDGLRRRRSGGDGGQR